MNNIFLNIIVASSLTLLVAACTSAGQYQSTQARLQQQVETISALDKKLDAAGNDTQRQQLLAEKKQAVRDGIALLKEVQSQKIAASRACFAHEKNIPESSKTCYEKESPEDTQANMMVMLLGQMETGHNGK